MKFMVLPDQMWAAATLLVAAAALIGVLAPLVLRRVGALMLVRALHAANDNADGYASPRARLRCI